AASLALWRRQGGGAHRGGAAPRPAGRRASDARGGADGGMIQRPIRRPHRGCDKPPHPFDATVCGLVITRAQPVITEAGKTAEARRIPAVALALPAACAKGVGEFPCEVPMNIHEYQAKALLKQYGAPVSEGRAVLTVDEAATKA